MNADRRKAFISEFLDTYCFAALRDKGIEYSRGEADVNSNFKRVGSAIGLDPVTVAYVYMAKHFDSISSFVKSRNTPSGESIESRLGDLINYALILACLLEEARPTPTEEA